MRATPFDAVWTTSPPEVVHFIGRSLSHLGVPWVADFRDPWSESPFARWDPISRALIRLIGRWVVAPARAVSAVTVGMSDSIGRDSGREVICVRNGFDTEAPGSGPVRPRSLGYFGRIDPDLQHPNRLFDALRALRAAGRQWTLDLYLTPGGGGGAAIDIPPDLHGIVRVLSPLPRAQALERMTSMAALLLLVVEDAGNYGRFVVPGKLYDYVGTGRPVLVLAPPGFEARVLVEDLRLGRGAWGGETASVLDSLAALDVDPEAKRPLSRAAAAEKMLRLLQGLEGGRARGDRLNES